MQDYVWDYVHTGRYTEKPTVRASGTLSHCQVLQAEKKQGYKVAAVIIIMPAVLLFWVVVIWILF